MNLSICIYRKVSASRGEIQTHAPLPRLTRGKSCISLLVLRSLGTAANMIIVKGCIWSPRRRPVLLDWPTIKTSSRTRGYSIINIRGVNGLQGMGKKLAKRG